MKVNFNIVFIFLLSITILSPGQMVSIKNSDSLLTEEYVFRKKPNIAVLPFYDANAQAKEVEFGRTVSAMLATALRSNTNFNVLERGELNQILTEQAVGTSGITREMSQSLSDLYNVEVLLIGDVSLINSTLHIDARLIETGSSKITVALYSTCQDLKNIRQVVVNLAHDFEQSYLRQWMGSITIVSEPVGAEVYLDDNYFGITTKDSPLKINDMLEGTYKLKFIRGGYYDWEGEISVLSKMERFVKVSLIAKPGAMNIYSDPAGAETYVDNNYMGVTPLSLKKVAEGEHEIRLVKDKYKVWTQKVFVRSFQPTDVKATLKVSPGILTINSIPAGAKINFRGQDVAQTPHTLTNITPGEVVVSVEKAGYESSTTSVYISPNSHETLDIVLHEKKGKFTVLSIPEKAYVYLMNIGGERKFIGTTPLLDYETNIGNYSIEVEKDDYFSNSKNIIVNHNQLTDVKIELKEKPGAVLVSTSPENARIYLDGSYKGRSSLQLDQIPKGIYQLRMSMPFAEEVQTVSIQPNQKTIIDKSFKKSDAYLIPATAIGVIIITLSLIAQ